MTNFIDIDASTDNNTLKSVLASYYVAIKADVLLLTKRNNKNIHRKNTNWNHPFADHRSQTISLEKKNPKSYSDYRINSPATSILFMLQTTTLKRTN